MKTTVTALVLLSFLGLTLSKNVVNTVEKLPYIVYIEGLLDGEWTFLCGGALISENHIVTAASCVDYLPLSDIRVTAGTSKLNEGGVIAKVENGFISTDYDPNTLDNDLILLKLFSKMPLSATIKPIALCSSNNAVGASLQFSGWTKPNGGEQTKTSKQVHSIIGKVIKQSDCIKAYSMDKLAVITDNMFCMTYSKGFDTCTDDGGGPAVRNKQLCGILSWQKNCDGSFPAVYTDVYRHVEFLKEAMTE